MEVRVCTHRTNTQTLTYTYGQTHTGSQTCTCSHLHAHTRSHLHARTHKLSLKHTHVHMCVSHTQTATAFELFEAPPDGSDKEGFTAHRIVEDGLGIGIKLAEREKIEVCVFVCVCVCCCVMRGCRGCCRLCVRTRGLCYIYHTPCRRGESQSFLESPKIRQSCVWVCVCVCVCVHVCVWGGCAHMCVRVWFCPSVSRVRLCSPPDSQSDQYRWLLQQMCSAIGDVGGGSMFR